MVTQSQPDTKNEAPKPFTNHGFQTSPRTWTFSDVLASPKLFETCEPPDLQKGLLSPKPSPKHYFWGPAGPQNAFWGALQGPQPPPKNTGLPSPQKGLLAGVLQSPMGFPSVVCWGPCKANTLCLLFGGPCQAPRKLVVCLGALQGPKDLLFCLGGPARPHSTCFLVWGSPQHLVLFVLEALQGPHNLVVFVRGALQGPQQLVCFVWGALQGPDTLFLFGPGGPKNNNPQNLPPQRRGSHPNAIPTNLVFVGQSAGPQDQLKPNPQTIPTTIARLGPE